MPDLPTAGDYDLMGRARAMRSEDVLRQVGEIMSEDGVPEDSATKEFADCRIELRVKVPVQPDSAPLAELASIVLGTIEESGIDIDEIKVSRK